MNKIYVTTCPKYAEILKVWLYLCNKFWQPNPEIVVLGNGECTIDLPDNATFVNVGDNVDYSVWCKNMGDYFDSIDEEYIAPTMDDMWITAPVDIAQLDMIQKEAKRLSIDRTYINRSYIDTPKLREWCRKPKIVWGEDSSLFHAKGPKCYYFISLHVSIWNRKRFVELCRQCDTPWEMEVEGSVYAREHGYKCAIPHGPSPVLQTGVVLKFRDPGGPNHLFLETMPKDVLNHLKDNGHLDHWIKNGTTDIGLK